METLSQAEFMAALCLAAAAGIATLLVMGRAHAMLSAELAARIARSIATLKED